SPAPDPDRGARALLRCWCQPEAGGRVERALKCNLVSPPERAQRLHRLVEPLPALLEWHADHLVVSSRRTWAQSDHQSAARKQVDRCEDLRGRRRPTKFRNGD